MAYKIIPHFLSRWFMPVGRDANDDFRALRCDGNGGLYAGPYGSYGTHLYYFYYKTSTGANREYLSSTPVPAGEIHVIKIVNIMQGDPTGADVACYVFDGTNAVYIFSESGMAGGIYRVIFTDFALPQGWYLQVASLNMSAGYSLALRCWGYVVKL